MGVLADGRDYLSSAEAIRAAEAEAGFENPNGVCMLGLANWLAAHRPTAEPAVAGEAECRRRRTSVSRVRENLTHGSMGGGRNLASVGSARATLAPPAYPTLTEE